MKYTVGTSAVTLDASTRARPLIQNLGPGDLYLNTDEVATTDNGVKIAVGEAIQFASAGATETTVSVISTQANTDVRVINMGEK